MKKQREAYESTITHPDIGEKEYYGVKNKVFLNKHPKKKNNEKVAAMYAAYQDGMSLDAIGRMYRKRRQSIYSVFRSRGYPLRSKQLKGLQVIDGIRFTEMKGGYLRGTVPGRGRILAHHYVYEKSHGEIPEGFCLYFLDGNCKNVALENLELIEIAKMSKKFNPTGRNQFSGKKPEISPALKNFKYLDDCPDDKVQHEGKDEHDVPV